MDPLVYVLVTVGRTGAWKWATDGILRLRMWYAVTSLMDIFPRSLITESSWPKEFLTGFPFHPLTVNTGQIVLIFIYNRMCQCLNYTWVESEADKYWKHCNIMFWQLSRLSFAVTGNSFPVSDAVSRKTNLTQLIHQSFGIRGSKGIFTVRVQKVKVWML